MVFCNRPGRAILSLLLVLTLCGLEEEAQAVGRIRVMALFSGKVMLEIDGHQRFLRAGEKSPEGVLLISATARKALLEVDGERREYELGHHVGGNYAKRERFEVRILRDAAGSYRTVGSINGRTTDMLLDTGATSIALTHICQLLSKIDPNMALTY